MNFLYANIHIGGGYMTKLKLKKVEIILLTFDPMFTELFNGFKKRSRFTIRFRWRKNRYRTK